MVLADAALDSGSHLDFASPLFGYVIAMALLVFATKDRDKLWQRSIVVYVVAFAVTAAGWYVYSRSMQGSRFAFQWVALANSIMTIAPWAGLVWWYRTKSATEISGERTARVKERESLRAEYVAIKGLVASLQTTLKTTSDRLSALDVGQAGALRSELSQLAARVREIESHGHGLAHVCIIKDVDLERRQFITAGTWEGMEKRLPCQMIAHYESAGGGGVMHFTATAINNAGDVSYVTVREKISVAGGEKYLQLQDN